MANHSDHSGVSGPLCVIGFRWSTVWDGAGLSLLWETVLWDAGTSVQRP